MNWEAIGAIGEFGGAFAVVVSLVYLASQIRAQNREARGASVHEIAGAFRDAISSLQGPEQAEVFAAALVSFDDLSDAQRLQYFSIIQKIFRVWEEAYYQYNEGRLDQRIWNAIRTQCSDVITIDAARTVWELRKHAYSIDFRSFVDSIEGGSYRLKPGS